MPPHAARTTAAFLRSRHGVRQALDSSSAVPRSRKHLSSHLAKFEMQTITSDTWDDELWGVTTDQNQSVEKTSLYFLFGRNDRWVADETRDDLIATRAGASGENGDWKPKMEVDEMGLPHGFCIGEYYPSLFLRWSRDDDADSKEGSVPARPPGREEEEEEEGGGFPSQ
ncbi:hypothetical protein H2203_003796 [Taxawa tesnikishii (nom. ined.)]|nr:hypothetical protein H2203_003796 [Dothideales sp. JES 119]